MGIDYPNLNLGVREFMVTEFRYDLERNAIYPSARLNLRGSQDWPGYLQRALRSYDDDWLAMQLRENVSLKVEEHRRRGDGEGSWARIPATAAQTLAEGAFNRYYMRGLGAYALQRGETVLEVVRGKAVDEPRPSSEAMIGKRVRADRLISDLRRHGFATQLRLPAGPNSGLTLRRVA